MRSKWKRKIVPVAAGALVGLALSAGAQAAFITYAASTTNATSLATTSGAIDLGSVTDFIATLSLGLTVTGAPSLPSTLTQGGEGLQVLQGCAFALASCTALDWLDITGKGTSLGTTFTQSSTPTQTNSYNAGPITVSGAGFESLRLKFNVTDVNPSASLGITGSLEAVATAVPEPGTWALMLAGIVGVAGVARTGRRLLV